MGPAHRAAYAQAGGRGRCAAGHPLSGGLAGASSSRGGVSDHVSSPRPSSRSHPWLPPWFAGLCALSPSAGSPLPLPSSSPRPEAPLHRALPSPCCRAWLDPCACVLAAPECSAHWCREPSRSSLSSPHSVEAPTPMRVLGSLLAQLAFLPCAQRSISSQRA
ncbi:hypothetical protein Zm00014a_028789 [Zea mays]|uniref:Uncharacterized protein n=1 Tax=Zea mays TaxID=4577 RepID=A0A3L6FNQ2_MAIZE|nr:hypothetical protein Zm00014a_028789 [Zea mays]